MEEKGTTHETNEYADNLTRSRAEDPRYSAVDMNMRQRLWAIFSGFIGNLIEYYDCGARFVTRAHDDPALSAALHAGIRQTLEPF
jgi:hypothetical protein